MALSNEQKHIDAAQGLEWSETFTQTGEGTGFKLGMPCRNFSMQLKGTGAAASAWSGTLMGSLDGVNWTALITHANGGDTDGAVKSVADKPVRYVRMDLGTLTLGGATNVILRAVALP